MEQEWIQLGIAPNLGPFFGSLFGPNGAPFLGIQSSDERADGRAAHDVDGNPGFLHRFNHPHMWAASAGQNAQDV